MLKMIKNVCDCAFFIMLLTEICSISLDVIRQADVSITGRDIFWSFLKIGETFAFNQSVGTFPVTYDFPKIKVNDGAILAVLVLNLGCYLILELYKV